MTENLNTIVIGGSGSLGSEICRILSMQGYSIAFTYNQNIETANDLEKELTGKGGIAQAFHLDLADLKEIENTIRQIKEALGSIDSLVIASGLATGQKWTGQIPNCFEITHEGFETMMKINVHGVFFVCREVARIMADNSGGKIIIVGSIDGIKPVPAPIDYACCKGALWGMTQALSKELGKYSILVNMVAPGVLEGGLSKMLSEKLMQEYIKHCSFRRKGKFSEVAKMIAFLASPKNSYLTGQTVILDGGL